MAALLIPQASAQVVEIPDPNLEKAVREALELTDNAPLTQQEMLKLTLLHAGDRGIADLTGLEYATNLENLSLFNNQVQDIAPLANLTNLTYLNLGLNRVENLEPLAGLIRLQTLDLLDNRVKDITPLANLRNLTTLILSYNQVSDLTPLANLINLEELYIRDNLVNDFTPLQGLNLIVFEYDEVCDIPPLPPPVRERIENRTFPSVYLPWGDVVGLDHLTRDQRVALHDLHWSPFFGLGWRKTAAELTYGVATSLEGDLAHAHEARQRRLDQNSNIVFLVEVRLHNHFKPEAFPPDSDFWLRDASGQIIQNDIGEYLINIMKPEVQDLLIKRIIAIERCGFYDGVFLDGFFLHGAGLREIRLYSATEEEIIQAYTHIFKSVRSQARDDFLIVVNASHFKPTRYAEYINGTWMEITQHMEIVSDNWDDDPLFRLQRFESGLSWVQENLRPPQITCLQGEGIPQEPPDSPTNRRWMRVFTTMSLTHSDGYVLYNTGIGQEHVWYSFWDADLGHPIGEKAQHYQNIDGLFIREFTNGWAVYNRSGQAQTITLSASATPVSDRGENSASLTHLLPDLDGEIYLKAKNPADVNGDGRVNILDLVQVANGFGQSSPDPNGDGAVNILDLVFVAQQFSQ